MGILNLGIKVEGADADIQQLETYLKNAQTLNFQDLMNLLQKVTKVTISKITVTTSTVGVPTTIVDEEILYTTP